MLTGWPRKTILSPVLALREGGYNLYQRFIWANNSPSAKTQPYFLSDNLLILVYKPNFFPIKIFKFFFYSIACARRRDFGRTFGGKKLNLGFWRDIWGEKVKFGILEEYLGGKIKFGILEGYLGEIKFGILEGYLGKN